MRLGGETERNSVKEQSVQRSPKRRAAKAKPSRASAIGSASGPTDTQRLDYLDRQRSDQHAHWSEDGWQNPGVIWRVTHWMRDGTYNFPKALSTMTVREAIDAEMAKTPNK